ncbi:endolytic transglycosylase MltG [Patescibacteria group bacterium]
MVLSVCLVFFILSVFFYNRIQYSVGDAEGIIEFEIKKGDNVLAVGDNLYEEGLISSKYYWLLYAWKAGLRGNIKAGSYAIDSKYTIPEVALVVTGRGDVFEKPQVSVTFPEGWDVNKMKLRLSENGLSVDEFSSLVNDPMYFYDKYSYEFLMDIPEGQSLEGYLFPDTYFFYLDSTSEDIISKMLDNFDKKLSQELRLSIGGQKKSIHEIITMASVIEKEVKSEADKNIVGGIFQNRVSVGQPLQSCATLAYILGENKKQYSYEDTKVESLYNTYLYPGLPPGPIANPGLSSIKAAVHPDDTDYNYFLSDPETGETVFSVTLDEHNLNKDRTGL